MSQVVCVPVKVDAFVLNVGCVNEFPQSTLAPITQPNYTFLQLDDKFIRSDVLPPVDLHDAGNLASNRRLTDLSKVTDNLREERVGVYIHWSLPRFYRAGAAMTADTSDKATKLETQRRAKAGFPVAEESPDLQAPNYRAAPNRWLVVRRLRLDSILPIEARQYVKEEFRAWVVQSDKKPPLGSLPLDVDLEVQTTPFVDGTTGLSDQAETFIGAKSDARGWRESTEPDEKVHLSLLNSSNVLLADYVPHNGNVFSMLDDMSYDSEGTLKKLEYANASYQVIGWHAEATLDPLYIVPATADVSNADRLRGCNMMFSPEPTDADFQTWLTGASASRTLCHGTMYDVNYSMHSTTDTTIAMAQKAAANLTAPLSPVTIGTNPLETMLAFVKAHAKDNELYADIQKLSQWLIKQGDDVDSQTEAADMLTAHNFAPSKRNGSQWFASGPAANAEEMPVAVSDDFIEKLKRLNVLESALAEAGRDIQQFQQDLFNLWWSHFARPDPGGDYLSSLVNPLKEKIKARVTQTQEWQNEIAHLSVVGADSANSPVTAGKVQKRAQDAFYTLRDPTMVISGINSPWPFDFLDCLKVRLASQLVGPRMLKSGASEWSTLQTHLSGSDSFVTALKDDAMADAAVGIIWEFYNLHPGSVDLSPWQPPTEPMSEQQFPLYHDLPPSPAPQVLRDCWNNTQPFCPLFVEWEAKYYHIPWEQWKFGTYQDQDLFGNTVLREKYGIAPGFDTETLKHADSTTEDSRLLSGRILILPQPAFSLAANVKQLFDSLPNDVLLQSVGDKAKQASILQQIGQLPYMSAPLSGFTSHLLTLNQGSHIKPTVRAPGQSLVPLDDAISVKDGLDKEALLLMDTETQYTPYGLDVSIESETVTPFKPVSHGQFYFTKLCVVDKFGQAISALDPRYSSEEPKMFPTISEFYQPELRDPSSSSSTPNIVTGADAQFDSPANCRCAQIPPNINQDARLNAHFMVRSDPSHLVRATEWDNPIMGWIVVNYIEQGVQFFLPDGTFYREVRLNQGGTSMSRKWAPFQAPPAAPVTGFKDFDDFISSCQNNVEDLISCVNASLDAMPPATSEYAEFMSAIIGRPLALVVTGWSLELATVPLQNQSTVAKNTTPQKELKDYSFALKIGDGDRVWDGMVGMFSPNTDDGDTSRNVDYSKMFTYFPSGTYAQPVTAPNLPDQYVFLKPYKSDDQSADPTALNDTHETALKIRSILMDPFSPVHGYTGILPIRSLKLPAWAVHNAMRKMTAFFQIGPIILPVAEPAYDSLRSLDPTKVDYLADLTKPATIPIPAIQSADWAWLQPYPGQDQPLYNALGVGPMDTRPRYERGPYVAVEGYMQLREPLEAVAAKEGG